MNGCNRPTIVLCPGFHAPELTQSFLNQLQTIPLQAPRILVFPSDRYPAFSSLDLVRFLHERLDPSTPVAWLRCPVILIGFSAGVVAAMGAALILETLNGTVRAVFAVDGWGVPILGTFPTHRLSHDYFTSWSSALLGAGQASFYASPGVDHLKLWQSPHQVQGLWVSRSVYPPQPTTELQFLTAWLQHYMQYPSSIFLTRNK